MLNVVLFHVFTAAIKSPLYIIIVQIIFSAPFGIIGFILSYFEKKKRVLLKSVLGGVVSVADFISVMNKRNTTESAVFMSFWHIPCFQRIYYLKFIYIHCSWCCPMWP